MAREGQVVASVLQELLLRDGARLALSGRDEDALVPILTFLCKHITDANYTPLLSEISMTVLDLYAVIIGRSEHVDDLLVKLRWRIHEQLALDAELLRLQGSLETLLAASL